MKNCVNLLCLKHNIGVDELTLLLGTTRENTLAILKEEAIITASQLKRLSDIFSTSVDKILCQ